MATTQHQQKTHRRKESRASAAGRDIFNRMLLLEKESKQRRASLSSPTSPRPDRPQFAMGNPPSAAASSSPQPPQASVHLPPPQLLAGKAVTKPPPEPLKIDTDVESETTEICLSPSWPDEVEKQRRKERKQKDREERRSRQEERPAKRLSKKPPAAMETQKMPSGLRRNSIVSFLSSRSPSRERSRRNSREEIRDSRRSCSSKRSQSTPASSTDDNWQSAGVSSAAPRLPSFRWNRSRNNSKIWDSDDAHEKDLVAFTCRFDAAGASDTKQLPKRTDGNVPPKLEGSAQPKPRKVPKPVKQIQAHSHAEQLPFSNLTFSSQTTARSSKDGSSYVHKQRMHQQQMSIEGFKDQQAVKLANELAVKAEAQTPLVDDQKENVPGIAELPLSGVANEEVKASLRVKPETKVAPPPIKTERSLSIRQEPGKSIFSERFSPEPPKEDQEFDTPVKSAPSVANKANTESAKNIKADKGLGNRRHSKPPLAKFWVSEKEVFDEEPAEKKSRFGRMLDPKIPFRERRDSTGSAKSNQNLNQAKADTEVADQRSTLGKLLEPRIPFRSRRDSAGSIERSSSRGHSRTRAVSSQNVSSEDVSPQAGTVETAKRTASTPEIQTKSNIPKSATDPTLSSIKTEPSKFAELQTKTGFKSVPVRPDAELVISSTNPEGLVRKTSITRPRSNPQLQTQSTLTNALPNLDFLPQLKHQPFTKSPRRLSGSPQRPTPPAATSLSKPQPPTPEITVPPRSPLRNSPPLTPAVPVTANAATGSSMTATAPTVGALAPPFVRSSTTSALLTNPLGSPASPLGKDNHLSELKPVAKMFVICCHCRFWHDLPSKLYEAMALPSHGLDSPNIGLHNQDSPHSRGRSMDGTVAMAKVEAAAAGLLETAVRCPWCEHGMSTWCCEGWTGVVYLHKRHH